MSTDMSAEFDTDIERDIERCVEVLRRSGIILYPTDTLWGIGCDACNSEAVERIFSLKRRSDSKSMLMLVDSQEMLQQWVEDIPSEAIKLISEAENPTTVIYDHPVGIAPQLVAEDGSAGFRITSELYSAELCRRLGHPLVSTSANISGRSAARYFDEIEGEIKGGVDFIAGYRRDDHSPHSPSSIVKVTGNGVVIRIR